MVVGDMQSKVYIHKGDCDRLVCNLVSVREAEGLRWGLVQAHE